MTQNGKGDKPRPLSTDWNTFSQNWDNIFKKKIDDPNMNAVEISKEFPKKKFSKRKN